MAIQQINLGSAPSGAGGDTQRAANEKINQNFSNTTHAASRLVGVASGQIPLAENVSSLAFTGILKYAKVDLKSITTPPIVWVERAFTPELPAPPGSSGYDAYTVISHHLAGKSEDYKVQFAVKNSPPEMYIRSPQSYSVGVGDWQPITTMKSNYARTSALAANVVMDADGNLLRSSSSLKYKDVIAKLEIDSDLYNKAMAVKPIVYRSKSEADPDDWHFLSFSAEELGELDPALTYWKTHDDVRDEETGEVTKVKLDKKEAEGINLNAICAVLHATNIYQDKKLKELEQRLIALESSNEPIE